MVATGNEQLFQATIFSQVCLWFPSLNNSTYEALLENISSMVSSFCNQLP